MRGDRKWTRWPIAALLGGALLGVGWLAYGPITGTSTWPIIRSVGEVCIYPAGESRVRASLGIAVGCYSSSCTDILYAAGNVAVDERNRSLRFTGRSVFRSLAGERFCTADCGGAGNIGVETGALEEGIYTIFIGDAEVGALGIPMLAPSACYAHGTWTEALPFQPSPTHTPPPYPWPPPQPTVTWAYPY